MIFHALCFGLDLILVNICCLLDLGLGIGLFLCMNDFVDVVKVVVDMVKHIVGFGTVDGRFVDENCFFSWYALWLHYYDFLVEDFLSITMDFNANFPNFLQQQLPCSLPTFFCQLDLK